MPELLPSLLPPLLASLQRPGSYCGQGSLAIPLLKIEVEGVGRLGLPIPVVQAEALARQSSPAPYGRGAETLYDPKVRRCGQLPPSALQMDPRFEELLAEILKEVREVLGVSGKIEAELYKLLIYSPGDFFSAHRDSEKAPHMFGTLVISLPSQHEGGELIVRHADEESRLDLSGEECLHWAAFYADCQHQLEPLRSGYRIALIYNLLLPKGRTPKIPDSRPSISSVAALLRQWEEQPENPVKLVYPLKHRYSLAELSFGKLKGKDAAIADVLKEAAAQSNCILRLGMLSIVESGIAEPLYVRSRRSRRYQSEEDQEYEEIEVTDRKQSIDAWRRPDDSEESLGAIEYEDHELSPLGVLEGEEPDEDIFMESTGNEGCSFERSYRRAALVLWPEAHEFKVLLQGDPDLSLGVLEGLMESGEFERAQRLAETMLEASKTPKSRQGLPQWRLRQRLFRCLGRLPDSDLLQRHLQNYVGTNGYDGGELEELLPLLHRLDHPSAAMILQKIVQDSAGNRSLPVMRLLDKYSREGGDLSGPLESLLPLIGQPSGRYTAPEERAEGLISLLRVLGRQSDERLPLEIMRKILQSPAVYPLDQVLGAAVLKAGADPAGELLRKECLAQLQERIGRPLAPPPDEKRSDAGLKCRCADCEDFRRFLVDPVLKSWTLRAIERRRQHLEFEIGRAMSDVSHQTLRTGSPYSLVCVKNRASYELLAEQRRKDLLLQAQLVGKGR